MKKLIINGLLVLAFVIIIVAIISGVSKLQLVASSDEDVDALMENRETAVAAQKATEEEKEVTVTVQQNEEETTSSDDDVAAFLNDVD